MKRQTLGRSTAINPAEIASRGGSALSLLRCLDWRIRHPVENILAGEYRSAFRGRGMEFDQVVKYSFGDDVRDIDWNVTARLGEPYRKRFVEEREITVILLFEDSPSLRFGSGGQSKREALLELAGLVMLLGAVNRDRVGIVRVAPEGNLIRPPVRGRGQILHAAATLFALSPPAATDAPGRIPWCHLARIATRHSVFVWLGDFPPRPEPEGWRVLQRRYATLGFRIDDPWDRTLPPEQRVAIYDPTAKRLVTLEGSAAERAAHADWAADREARWHALFPNRLSRLVVSTTDDRLDALMRFFRARMDPTRRL